MMAATTAASTQLAACLLLLIVCLQCARFGIGASAVRHSSLGHVIYFELCASFSRHNASSQTTTTTTTRNIFLLYLSWEVEMLCLHAAAAAASEDDDDYTKINSFCIRIALIHRWVCYLFPSSVAVAVIWLLVVVIVLISWQPNSWSKNRLHRHPSTS